MKTISLLRTALFPAIVIALLSGQVDKLKAIESCVSSLGFPSKTLAINITNFTSINSFRSGIHIGDHHNCECNENVFLEVYNDISNGASAVHQLKLPTPCQNNLKIVLEIKDSTGNFVDVTGGGFPIKYTEGTQYFGISQCSRNKSGYCGGPRQGK